jgi:hypothetical protein
MKVQIDVPLQRVSDLLCSALEGGSNYWYMIEKQTKPPIIGFHCMAGHDFPHIDWPLNVGGSLSIASMEEPDRAIATLDLDAAQRGLQLMAEKYPHHWGDFLAENDDATTGDVFLQLALYGEVIYG